MPLTASGVRICWPDLPEVVRVWVEEVIGGGAIICHQSQAGGFSPGTADRVMNVSGSRAFVKAVSPDQNEHTPNLHRREASIVAQLPQTGKTPQLLGHYDDGHWVALVKAHRTGSVGHRPPRATRQPGSRGPGRTERRHPCSRRRQGRQPAGRPRRIRHRGRLAMGLPGSIVGRPPTPRDQHRSLRRARSRRPGRPPSQSAHQLKNHHRDHRWLMRVFHR